MNSAGIKEIGLSRRIPTANLPDLRGGKRQESVAVTVVNSCYFLRSNTTGCYHVVLYKLRNGEQMICPLKPQRQLSLQIGPVPALHLLRKMQRNQIMTGHDRRNIGTQTAHRIRRKEHIGTAAFQCTRDRPLEPPVEKKRMPGGREKHHGRHILTVNKAGIVWTVEKEEKLVFRMIFHHPAHNFVRVPAKTLQLARQ